MSTYNPTPSHSSSKRTLAAWLRAEGVPGIAIPDTRGLAQKLRDGGVMPGKIVFNGQGVPWVDPNASNLAGERSQKKVRVLGKGKKTCVLIDCGAKRNIEQELVARGLRVVTVPWDYNVFKHKLAFHYVVISNGPGDPKKAVATIATIQKCMKANIPILGICLGNQILALAAGGDTYKLKFGHRGQNQPAQMVGSERCFLTTQNHGFAVRKLPKGFKPWFVNANDGTNEGIMHTSKPWMSVQFHPEGTPGPWDTEWVFDYFLEKANAK